MNVYKEALKEIMFLPEYNNKSSFKTENLYHIFDNINMI